MGFMVMWSFLSWPSRCPPGLTHVPSGFSVPSVPPPDTLNYHHLTGRCQRHDRSSSYLILFCAHRVRAVFFVLRHVPRYLAVLSATAGRPLRWKGSSQNFVFLRLALSCGTCNLFAMDTHLSSQQLCFHVPNSFHLLLDTHTAARQVPCPPCYGTPGLRSGPSVPNVGDHHHVLP